MTNELDKALATLEKRYGKAAPKRGSDIKFDKPDPLPSGILTLDAISGIGGIPRGRITEIFGWEDSAKSTVCQIITAQAQKLGYAAWLDMEGAMDENWARKCGVDWDNLLYSQPDHGEQAHEIIEALVRSNQVVSIVVDSVATLIPKAEVEGQMGDATFGSQGRLNSQALRKINPALKASNTALIFINQNRVKIGGWTPSPSVVPETQGGGTALGFYATWRLRLSANKGKEYITVNATTKKNKMGGRFGAKASFNISYDGKVDTVTDLFEAAKNAGAIEQSGGWFNFGDKKWHGEEKAIAALREDEQLVDEIREALK